MLLLLSRLNSVIAFTGNIAYIPREYSGREFPSLNDLRDGTRQPRGIYVLRTTSQLSCEMLDEQGNVFSAYSNGEIKISESEGNIGSTPGESGTF